MAKASNSPRGRTPPPPVSDKSAFYVVAGSEALLRREQVGALLGRLSKGGGDDLGLVEYDAEADDVEVAAVLDDVRTPSLLTSRRTVLVRRADDFVSDHRQALEAYVDRPSECGVLILECEKFPATTRLYKKAAAMGGLILCEPPKPWEVPTWVQRRCSERYSKKIDADAAAALIDMVGEELGRLDSELGKLATYVGARTAVNANDVAELVGSTRQEIIFGVTDAMGRRDTRRALELWDRVLANDREAPYRAIGGLAWGMRRLVDAKRLVTRGTPAAEAANSLRMRVDPASLARTLGRFTLRQWEDMLTKLLRIDMASKSGGGTVPVGVEKFIVECSGGA